METNDFIRVTNNNAKHKFFHIQRPNLEKCGDQRSLVGAIIEHSIAVRNRVGFDDEILRYEKFGGVINFNEKLDESFSVCDEQEQEKAEYKHENVQHGADEAVEMPESAGGI